MRDNSWLIQPSRWSLLVLLAAGCGHSEPFAGATQPPLDGPLVASAAVWLISTALAGDIEA